MAALHDPPGSAGSSGSGTSGGASGGAVIVGSPDKHSHMPAASPGATGAAGAGVNSAEKSRNFIGRRLAGLGPFARKGAGPGGAAGGGGAPGATSVGGVPGDLHLTQALGIPGGVTDGEMALHCAFCLPGVLQSVGRARWRELRGTFHVLARHLQWKVRRTLAHSLHEVRSRARARALWRAAAATRPRPPSAGTARLPAGACTCLCVPSLDVPPQVVPSAFDEQQR